MKWFQRKRVTLGERDHGPTSRAQALAHCPLKNAEVIEEKGESGEILLSYPLVLRPWLLNLTRRLGLQSREPLTRKLQLDEMGTLTWTLMNGSRTVQDMVELVSRRYNLNRRETEVAVTSFLRELGRRGLIAFRPSDSEASENST